MEDSSIAKIKKKIAERKLTKKDISSETGISQSYLTHIFKNDRSFEEEHLAKLLRFLSLKSELEKVERDNRKEKSIKQPKSSSPKLMQIIGYYLGDGYAGKRSVRFKDMDRGVLETYKSLIEEIFGIKGEIKP